jgi:hypothetical protein
LIYRFAEKFAEKTNSQKNEKINDLIYLRTEVVYFSQEAELYGITLG